MLEWLRELPDEDRAKRIDQAWRNFTASEDGQIVAGSLLEELGLLEPITTSEAQTRHNVAVMILSRIGRNSTNRVLEALIRRGSDGRESGG